MIVIGSRAMMRFKEVVKPNDLDLVGTYEEAQTFRKALKPIAFHPINDGKSLYMKCADGLIVEIEIAWEGSRAEGFLKFAERFPEAFSRTPFRCGTGPKDRMELTTPSLNVLYMLKMSHRYLKDSPHFLKTMRDIQDMRKMGAKIEDDHHPYYLKRMAETYTYSHPRLNVSKDGFFDEQSTGVVYTYDHDSIHEAVKTLNRPAYTYFKPEDSEVLCSKEMFFALQPLIRLYAVLEEAYVLALERSLIPFPNGKTPKEAFDMALMKVCTSITSGWFREFAWENYDKVQELYSHHYVHRFRVGLESGVVKPFNGRNY